MPPTFRPTKSRFSSRIERDEEISPHEDENAHLWAVSYSDFLMTLLAFFILFFSIDSSHRSQLIMNLAQEFSAGGTGSAMENSGKNQEAQRLPASIFKDLSGLQVAYDHDNDNLVVNFPDDLFKPGQHEIDPEKLKVIQGFLKVLKPYGTQVNIYFEGHADKTPLRRHKNDIVSDNFVLSSLRANSVLALARNNGFADKHMFIQAASSNLRNSRSLSIRIQPLSEGVL